MEVNQIKYLGGLLRRRELSCRELTEAYLQAIEEKNSTLNALVTVTPDAALETAAAVDKKIAAGEPIGVLEGIPMVLKDNISTQGVETTCCSKMLRGYRPIYDATVWELLKTQNAVLLGKANMDEFAMGSSCETSCFGGAKNPHNPDRVAGGSSGGVASAVGAGLAVYGLGSDTGGSIRQPASFCGITGLKPTYGAVSRYGLIAYASSLDQIGPITTGVEDTALVYDAISVHDRRDATSQGQAAPTAPMLKSDIRGLKIGMAEEYFSGIRTDVADAVTGALDVFRSLGASVESFRMPALQYALPVYYILACAEASSNLGRYDGIRYGYQAQHYAGTHEMMCRTRSEGFGREVKRRILLGTYVLSAGYYDAYYKKAQNLRRAITGAFRDAFSHYDLLVAPTVPMTAFPLHFTQQDAVETYLTDVCTVPVNIAGLPAISVPCGQGSDGMPVGMQLIGAAFSEARILNAAYQFECAAGESVRQPYGSGVQL